MSGLEKFQSSEAWRTNFKKFLTMERKPEIVQNTLRVTESQRYSLDIGEDLKNIIEQKKNKKTVRINSNKETIPTDLSERNSQSPVYFSEENMERCENNAYGDESFETLHKLCEIPVSEDQNTNNVSEWQKSSDESFEALERMCDKTASDPNSTLFQYLHSDRKDKVLAEAKKRSRGEISSNSQNEEDQLLMKINNCTLLDEIEAPSRMWENTICGDTILQTSPVKMVGLLRPSTIIEEVPDDSANSDLSSQLSFHTATKGGQSDISSNAYETAHDTTKSTTVEPPSISNKHEEEKYSINDISLDLIDLEKTLSPLPQQPPILESKDIEVNKMCSVESELNESVIEILSDDEDENVHHIGNITCNNHEIKKEISLNSIEINLLSDDEPEICSQSINSNRDICNFDESPENNKENCPTTHEQSEKSMQFNDTMEEVEYMIKKGIEYMAAEASSKKSPPKNKDVIRAGSNDDSRIEQNSSMKYEENTKNLLSGSKAKSSTYTTPIRKTPFDIKPFPKLDVFTKPSAHYRPKEVASKMQKFSHIVSPIGTYMKKTAQTPLMSSINCKTTNYFNSTAIQQLENESRLYQPQFGTVSDGSELIGSPSLPGVSSSTKRALPKKAYISSDFKHIVDERTPITIPGGKKIQKYLENAMMPAVLRHEGKFKMASDLTTPISSSSGARSKLPLKPSETNATVRESNVHDPRRNNASLADLSIMSGDISMYTIMDAQKF